ncbi:MAG: signal peptidase II [Firmicutes bacterium]|nr:signal peptidase II [Bacillota bacterium]
MILGAAAILVILLDQLSKYLVAGHFLLNFSTPLLGRILYLTYIKNSGIAFGFAPRAGVFLIILTAAVIIVFIFVAANYSKKETAGRKLALQIAAGLVLGGSIGNLIDRIRLGAVIDFIDFKFWPVFNFADSAVTIGILIILVEILIKRVPTDSV